MRVPKYRAWYNGKMYEVVKLDLWGDPDQTTCELASLDFDEEELFDIYLHEVKLMQSTGLHDKNGVEIYEGDILELINASGRRILAICKFGSRRLTTENGDMIDIQCFYFEVEGRKTNPMVCNYKAVHDLEIMRVIGNIFNNLELLESEE